MARLNEDRWEEVKDFVQTIIKKTGVPGCSVGVLHQGEVKTAGFGVSNVERMTPVCEDTLFQIGSISKTFTATVAMKLVEEGKLDLHAPVRTYLPDFKVADETVSAEVTPYHLLTHTAGWEGNLFLDTGDGADAIPKYIQRMVDLEQLFPLGSYFSYNNAGYPVLGGILEVVSGMRIEDLFRTYIAGPLGLERLFFNAGEVITYDFAVGHHRSDEGNIVARPWRMSRCILPMGGIVTCVRDLLEYARCYLLRGKTPNGGQMLKAETIDEMFAPKVSFNEEDLTSRGYGWGRRDFAGGYIVAHSGGTNGQDTQLSLLPEHDFALAIFTNSSQGGQMIQHINEFLLKIYLDVTLDKPKEIDSTPEQLRIYTGDAYRPGYSLHLEMLGDHLVGLQEVTVGFPSENDPPPPPAQPNRLGRCSEDRLIVLDGDGKGMAVDVLRNAAGEIAYLRVFGRIYRFDSNG